ncbi:hypothetical protein MRX96_042490 [Rhipicephalus microplus]
MDMRFIKIFRTLTSKTLTECPEENLLRSVSVNRHFDGDHDAEDFVHGGNASSKEACLESVKVVTGPRMELRSVT